MQFSIQVIGGKKGLKIVHISQFSLNLPWKQLAMLNIFFLGGGELTFLKKWCMYKQFSVVIC